MIIINHTTCESGPGQIWSDILDSSTLQCFDLYNNSHNKSILFVLLQFYVGNLFQQKIVLSVFLFASALYVIYLFMAISGLSATDT